eukprot:TRINITY_DN78368_c0_g1_i1.p1 TRINITY_DN78368_c0_g1~~TRINITY_DN78368_c0_g1_i1.p1  ORF type:complete len:367 (+),score=50.83 TRINITY_DN78368_c0_g1_i1:56-1156(+)
MAASLLGLAVGLCGATNVLATSASAACVRHWDGLACEAEADVGSHLIQAGSAAKVTATEKRGRGGQSDASSPNPPSARSSPELPAPTALRKPFFLHVPKCGSSFETLLVQYVCSGAIPENLTVLDPQAFFRDLGYKCPGSKFGRLESDHRPLHAGIPLQMVVTMLREPSSRVLSGYNDNLHDCVTMQQHFLCNGVSCLGDVFLSGRWIRNASVIDPVEYAKCVENCAVNMLTGKTCEAKDNPDVEAAVRKVGELGFVGLTEEWNMSVCLFHAKFGGRILASEIYNTRPGVYRTAQEDKQKLETLTAQAERMLGDWPATIEMRVYEAARARFWQEIERWGVRRESCQSQIDMAFDRAGTELPAEPIR